MYCPRPPGLAANIIALSWCCFALLSAAADQVITYQPEVSVLRAVKQQLKDPLNHLANWGRSDPCQSNWTGVICSLYPDGYLHVQELRFLSMNLSGSLAPELGQLNYTTILDFMWNNISGGIPREIGNMTSLQLLLLSGNQISGPLPDELGYLPNLIKFQLDLNNISGSLPRSFANLKNAKHFHMNNNSISGQIPPELSLLPALVHFLLDNNNLSGYLPSELYKMPSLKILQLNNNNFNGTGIPESYGKMFKLLKLSLRNCSLQGSIPDLSSIPGLLYLDLSGNQLNGIIPGSKLSNNIITIDLSNNMLIGSIPGNFSGLPSLQKLSLANNRLTGTVPSTIWQNLTFNANATLTLDFRTNYLSNISGIVNPPSNVSIMLQGNPICTSRDQQNISQFCGPTTGDIEAPGNFDDSTITCSPQACATSEFFECVQASPGRGFCALPLVVVIRLRSPSFSDFRPYMGSFEVYITSSLGLDLYQLKTSSFTWEEGPRLKIDFKIFPQYVDTTQMFNSSEIQHLVNLIATFSLPSNDTFGPYDLLGFIFVGFYQSVFNFKKSQSGMNIGALLGIVLGTLSCTVSLSLIVAFIFYVKHKRRYREVSRGHRRFQLPIRIEGVKEFSFVELETATTGFHISTEIGHGSYGKVYKGVLADGTFVAIKRAQRGSLQCQREFLNEIEFLSRLHHRNLVTLVGYCYEEGEQMLVYEFMPHGSLHSLLSARFREPLSFSTRLHIALGSAKGVLYLHTEADPPIIHRDVKANNILLDSKFTAKVSDFGISRLAPVQDGEGVAAPISTVVKGTPGYLDPEYFLNHKLTEKSDVYSLGIVFLELLTGMKPISHGKNIVREVHTACESGMMFSIIDQRMGHIPSECTKRFMELALKCCQDTTEGRPSMLDVVRELENITSMIPKAETISSSEPYASSSQMSGGGSTSQISMRASLESSDFPGSDLISGVIPTIRPR